MDIKPKNILMSNEFNKLKDLDEAYDTKSF